MHQNEIKVINSAIILEDNTNIDMLFEELAQREEFACVGYGCSGDVCLVK